MTEENTKSNAAKETAKCSECARDTKNYNEFISPENEKRIVCLDCMPSVANNAQAKPPVKCDECDTVRDHYVTFVLPSNEIYHVCWSCQQREDMAFNTKPGWKRRARQNDIESVIKK